MKYSYIYTPGGQILAQQVYNSGAEPNEPNDLYFYIHDRLGSVRLVINDAADVNNSYTYSPSGEMFASECTETVYNPFLFTGQWWDPEIRQYYLRARMYSPYLGRFTTRDPVDGIYKHPLTLHRYLYCLNDSINRTDPSGLTSAYGLVEDVLVGGAAHAAAVDTITLGITHKVDFLIDLGILMQNEVGTIIEMHHVYPKFLGGDSKGIRFPMPTDLHRGAGSSLHNKIYEQLLASAVSIK